MSALVSIGLMASLVMSAPAQEVTLKWSPKVGDVSKTVVTMKMATDFGNMDITMRPRAEVTKVTDKEIVMKSWLTEFKMFMDGQDLSEMAGQAVGPEMSQTLTFSPYGVLLKSEGGQGMESPRAAMMQQFYYPEKALKVGESWVKEFKADSAKGTFDAKAKYTLVGEETVNGTKSWKVSYVFSEMIEQMPMSSMGTAWIDQANGELVKLDGKFENAVFTDQMPPVNATITIVREK